MSDQPRPSKSPIVLIHGLWMTPQSWQGWKERFESRGHNVLTPGWPGIDDRDVEAIREDPSALEGLGLEQVTDHYEAIVRGLDAAPIIMGHSFGGLVTQILLDRGLGAAGVGVCSSPFKGIVALAPSTLRVVMPALRNPFGKGRTVMLTSKQFNYAFANTLDPAEAAEIYARLAIPGPARPLFQAAFANVNPNAVTKVNYKNDDRAPLLLIAAGEDNVIPVSVSEAAVKRYAKSEAKTELKVYPDRGHEIVGEPGWEEVADHALEWAEENAAR